MSKLIGINLLLHGRTNYLEFTKLTLGNIKDKHLVKLNVLSSNGTCNVINDFVQYMNSCGIETENIPFSGSVNYMKKITHAINQPHEYSFNVDDDCFMSTPVWDYIINNMDYVLSNNDNLLFAPCLSNGIPTCDYFACDTFTKEESDHYDSLIAEQAPCLTKFISGCDYTFLQEYAKPWNEEKFYEAVTNMGHYYKGVHPVRFSIVLQNFMNSAVINHIDAFKNPCNMYLDYITNRPYMCNSVFAIKTSTWKNIIEDTSLSRDEFDEVQINLYRQQNNLKMVFVRNAFGVHIMYNTVNRKNEELEFYHKFIEEFKK